MRSAVMLMMSIVLAPGVSLADVTADECQRHRDEFVSSLEENRSDSIREIDEASLDTNDPDQKALLAHERNQAWEFEERMRATADQVFRDCMTHVRKSSTGS